MPLNAPRGYGPVYLLSMCGLLNVGHAGQNQMRCSSSTTVGDDAGDDLGINARFVITLSLNIHEAFPYDG